MSKIELGCVPQEETLNACMLITLVASWYSPDDAIISLLISQLAFYKTSCIDMGNKPLNSHTFGL